MRNDRDHDELLMLYQVTVTDLSYFKTQQWSVATYAFLLYAGLAGVNEFVGGSIEPFERPLLTAFTLAVLSAAVIVIAKLQSSIEVRKARLDAVKANFGQSFRSAWNAKDKGKEYIHSVWFLHSAVVLGAIVVVYITWRTQA